MLYFWQPVSSFIHRACMNREQGQSIFQLVWLLFCPIQFVDTVVMCSSVISSRTPHRISTTWTDITYFHNLVLQLSIWEECEQFKMSKPGTPVRASHGNTPWSWGRRTPSTCSSPSACQWRWNWWRYAPPWNKSNKWQKFKTSPQAKRHKPSLLFTS